MASTRFQYLLWKPPPNWNFRSWLYFLCPLALKCHKLDLGKSSPHRPVKGVLSLYVDHSQSSTHVASVCWPLPLEGLLSSQGCLSALVWCGDPEQNATRPQPLGHAWLSGSVPQLCPQSPEPQWLLCFPDSLSQGKIPFGLSQEKTHTAF